MNLNDKKAIQVKLLGQALVVEKIEDARLLYSMGFYGKPIGVDKPKDASFDSPLILNPLEGLYLAEKGVIKVVDSNGLEIPLDKLKRLLLRSPRLKLLYSTYKSLRDSGFVVKPGLKFGSDFAVYRHGPGIDHAPYIVTVAERDKKMDPIEIVRAGRLSHSVRKTFILAVEEPNSGVRYIMFKWLRI